MVAGKEGHDAGMLRGAIEKEDVLMTACNGRGEGGRLLHQIKEDGRRAGGTHRDTPG